VTPETEKWVEIAKSALEVAALALHSGYLRAALFHSHESVEKLLKAIWVEMRGGQPEKTHNLPYLANELGLDLSDEQKEFLRKLSWELIPSRYPEGEEPDRESARWYHDKAKELFSWLLQMLK
jgi:HEPN domain-containing protein